MGNPGSTEIYGWWDPGPQLDAKLRFHEQKEFQNKRNIQLVVYAMLNTSQTRIFMCIYMKDILTRCHNLSLKEYLEHPQLHPLSSRQKNGEVSIICSVIVMFTKFITSVKVQGRLRK